MENSKAYLKFINAINLREKSGRFDGYDTDLFTHCYDWERQELEQLVWDRYCKHADWGVIYFFPQLRGIDVIPKIKKDVFMAYIPSDISMELSVVLYNMLGDIKYLEIIEKNIMAKPDYIGFVPTAFELKPDSNVYSLFRKLCIGCTNNINRMSAVRGMLYCKTIVSNPNSIPEIKLMLEYDKKINKKTPEERKEAIEAFEAEIG